MAKKDPFISENIDRGEGAKDDAGQNTGGDKVNDGFTEVENANASGLGSMGRNDEGTAGDEDSSESGAS